MLLASTAALLAAELLLNPAELPMTVTVELRVVAQPVVPGRDFEVEGTVTNPTDTPVAGCISSTRIFRVEGSAESEQVTLADPDVGRCRPRGGFSLEPGRTFRWKETLPAGATIGEGPGKVVASFALYQWRRRLDDGKKRDIRWDLRREAPFTAGAR
ncbi:MAG TPA: hypothetical protein VF139_04705 [Candidatus Polarisedimenticolaceae bacterium]